MTTNTQQPHPSKATVRNTIDQLKKFRRGIRLNGLSIREMIETGRR